MRVVFLSIEQETNSKNSVAFSFENPNFSKKIESILSAINGNIVLIYSSLSECNSWSLRTLTCCINLNTLFIFKQSNRVKLEEILKSIRNSGETLKSLQS